ncbi:MAG: hypothetical protein K8S13_24505 [Desulfobacula sp.]|uniref:hypothetical protein n=1 Tax=Desulfobacula sp. TaxID=2593537 RepID=UPI0025C2CE1A|nr:hypothetical protein [Desulfobacula sp.]MCD4722992.1 hypothetical protein [Desulfobacula sp.]
MIRLPYDWDIQETYSDTLYGIIASNNLEARNNPEKFQLISVTGYQTEDSLITYFKNELRTLKKDKNMKVLDAGQIGFEEEKTYWVRFESLESEHTIMNIVKYIKPEKRNEIYLIQSAVYKTDDFMERLCFLKRLVDSFELVIEN